MDLIQASTSDNTEKKPTNSSKKSWVSPALICIAFINTMNNLSVSADSDAASAAS